MSNPDPQSQNKHDIWASILKAADGLPAPLRFIIVFGVLLVVLLVLGAVIPEKLVPLLYFLLIGGLGFYGWWEAQNARQKREEREHKLAELKTRQEHKAVMRQMELTHEERKEQKGTVAEPVLADPGPEPDKDALPGQYLYQLLVQCGSLSVAAVDPRAQHSQAAKIALQSVFTALDVADTRPEKMMKQRNRSVAPDEGSGREPALAAISRYRHLVLLGQPGSGKSTLVNFLTYCLAGEGSGHEQVNLSRLVTLGWSLPALWPVRVILRDYAARGLPDNQDLWTFISHELATNHLSGYSPLLHKQLRDKGGILLLDGLDEVPQAHQRREQLRTAVLDFVGQFPQVRVVVTSRPYAYDADWQLPDFVRVDLLDFNQDQIDLYVGQWYTVTSTLDPDLPPERGQQYAEQLKEEVRHNRNLAELAPRPLLLALMVSLHRWHHGGGLPQKREELYDQSVNLLLDLWQRPKQLYDDRGKATREETSALVELGISRDALRDALSQVAFTAHHDQPELVGTADIPGSQLAQVLYDAPGRKPDVSQDRLIDYVKDRAGLLEERGRDRQGRRIYAFPHRTFQEYLAACHLLAQSTFPVEMVRLARQGPDRWREAVLLAAGRGGAKSQALAWQLVQALCPEPLPATGARVFDNLKVVLPRFM